MRCGEAPHRPGRMRAGPPVRAMPSESCRPSHAVRAVPSESCRPSHAVRVMPSQSCRPSHAVRVMPSESCRPSHAVRAKPSESCRPSLDGQSGWPCHPRPWPYACGPAKSMKELFFPTSLKM